MAGELDLATCDSLTTLVETLCRQDAKEIVMDLRALAFMDSTGLNALLRSWEHCRAHECEFALVADGGPSRRLFEVTGLMTRLPFRDAPPARDDGGEDEGDGAGNGNGSSRA